ncbi:MAG: diguanylate cyclase [Oscillospiraceae bacterium]
MLDKISRFNSHMLQIMTECKDNYIFIEDTKTHHCRWSHNVTEMFGLENECYDNTDMWRELIHASDFDGFNDVYKLMIDGRREQINNEYRFKATDGTYVWMHCNGWYIAEENGTQPMFTGVISKVDLESTVDPITNLRGNYDFRMALSDITKNKKERAILILGIDEFKEINDLYSYSFGDRALAAFAQKMVELIPQKAMLYRLDGDGFGMIFPTGETKDVLQYYNMMKKVAQTEISVDKSKVSFTISGGASRYPNDGNDSEELYRNARMALRNAKSKGKNQLVVFKDDILTCEHFKMKLLGSLRESIKMGFKGFSLKYQPLINANNEELYGCEALLRWENPDFPKGVSPCDFIPVLEESGLILEVGNWVIETAMEQCALWSKVKPDFQMNINVSSAQFENPNFKFWVVEMIVEHGIQPSLITLELTESGKIIDTTKMQQVFDFIRGQGIKIAFDDFGTGYASLGIFRVLSADELKIDRSFLDRISYDVTDRKIITQIVNLCHSMNMTVCVEGIETAEVEAAVKQMGADLLQGYYYSLPLTCAEFETAYFAKRIAIEETKPEDELPPEHKQSMVYAPLRPAQPMSREDVVDNAYAGIFQVGMDHEFTFLTCNEGYRRMLGYTAQEMDEKFKNRALGFVHEDDTEYVNEEIRRQLSLGDTVTIEFRIVKANGTPIWILGTGNVVKSRHGGASLIVVIIDNDKIKKKNLEIKKEYKFQKNILDNVVSGIKCVRFDAQFTIDYISPGFLSILGYTKEDIQTIYNGKYINMICEEDRKLVINDIVEQLKVSNVVTMHYRTPCKNGKIIWVETISKLCPPDEDGIQRAYSSVVSISDAAGEQETNRGLNVYNRYQAAVEQWGDILFEYDFQSGALEFSDNFNTVFGRNCKSNVDEEMRFVHEDDRKAIRDAFETVHKGMQPQPVDVRAMTIDGQFHWYSIKFTQPEKFGDVPVSAIGKITDINAEKCERDNLLEQSQRDIMTGLLNKGTAEVQVRKVIANAQIGQLFAMYIIDIDDFKKVNDRWGHFNGDKVIREIATRIKSSFRENDIVGRAGGDEFLAFIPYSGENSEIIAITERLMAALRKNIMLEQDECQVSVSVGIACYPFDGTQFYDLFRRADSALYRAKELGKNAYCFAAK